MSNRRRFLLLLDYDGTLAPIRPTPELARLDPGIRRLLRRLSRRGGMQLGFISGRSLSELRKMVGVPGAVYAGNHGYELEGPGIRFTHPKAQSVSPVLARIASKLRRALRAIPGAWVESKRLSLSVHWRKVSAAHEAGFHRAVLRTVAPWIAKGRVRITPGKRVVEVRPPAAWNKGAVVAWLMRAYGCPRGGVLYAGDDWTDEDAFRVVNRVHGISIFVGPPVTTAARWRVRGPKQMHRLLRQFEEHA